MTVKKIVFYFLVVLPLFATAQPPAPHTKILEGSVNNFKLLKDQTSYNLVFNYDNMMIGKGEREADYLEKKKNDHDAKEPGSGKGAAFEKMWFDARKKMYEPSFVRSFEKFAEVKTGDPGARYTLILKTTRTEGGWNGGVMAKPAEIDLQLWVVETGDNSKVLVKVGFSNAKGMESRGGDFEMTERIQNAYLYASKAVGDFFRRKTK